MKMIVFWLLTTVCAQMAHAEAAQLKYAPITTLSAVAQLMDVRLNPSIRLPKLRLESQTSLVEFQNAFEKQWEFVPTVFINAYSVKRNQIFLMDKDAGFYNNNGRCMDDSLALLYAIYIQFEYLGATLENSGQYMDQANDIQVKFRDLYCH